MFIENEKLIKNGFDNYLQNLDDIDPINCEKVIADLSTRLLLGKGIFFDSENKETLSKWEEWSLYNKTFDKIWYACHTASIKGYSLLCCQRSKTGRVFWLQALDNFNNNVGTAFANEKNALVYLRFVVDQRMLYIRSAYDSEQCINEIYDEVANKYVSVETINTTLPPDFQIPAVWKHNIGRVPIKLIQNKPYPSPYYTLGNLIECSDTHGCEKLKHHINTTHREYLKYIIVAKPRVALGGMTAYETTKKFNDDDESFGWNNPDGGKFSVRKWLIRDSDYLVSTESSTGDMKVQQVENQLNDYINASRNLMDLLAEYSGYSVKTNSSAQKTSTESTTQFSNSLETTNFKRRYIGDQVKDLIQMTFHLLGIDLTKDETFRFEFNKNIALDQAQIRDNYIKEIQVGVSTPIEMISDLKGVSDQQADDIWDYNVKWFKENNIPIAIQQSGMVSGVNGASMPQGGRPNDLEKDNKENGK